MANNTINDEINEMKRYFSEQLPNWEKATAEMLLTALTNWLCWLFYRIPGKVELKKRRLIY